MKVQDIEYQKSGFSLSIGTGISLETLFEPVLPVYDPERIVPKKYDLNKCDEVYFNVATLLRNIFSSLNESDYNTLSKSDINSLLMSEFGVISNLFENNTNGRVKPYFYVCDYSKALSGISNPTFSKLVRARQAVTPKALRYETKMKVGLELAIKEYDKILKFKSEISPKHRSRGIIFTHYAWDLLFHHKFSSLVLLESHTGKTKVNREWWSKYYKVPKYDMSILPFIKQFLYIFGDNHMFSPMSILLRRQLLDLGKKCRWHPLITTHTIRSDMEHHLNDKLVLDMFNSL